MDRVVSAHVRALDGVRGAAVLGVLAFHLAPLDGGDRRGLLPGGWLGVDTFLTLSGYLITTLLLTEVSGGRLDLRRFWRRRLRRLQPALLVLVAVLALGAGAWSAAGTGDAVRRQAVAAIAAVSNWLALNDGHDYAAGAHPSVFEHLWSLGVEEQFYVAWPLVVAGLALVGWRHRAVLAVAVAGTIASWVLLATLPLSRAYLGTDARVGSILVGAALATVLPFDSRYRWQWGGALAGAGIAVSVVAWVWARWPPGLDLAVLLPVHAVATAAVLAGVVLAPGSPPARALAWRPLAGIGKVSYGLYLWHWPVFVVCTPARLGLGTPATTVVRLTATAALTWLSWRLVEHPVRRDIVLRRTRLAFPVAVVLVVVAASIGVNRVAPAPAWALADGAVVTRSAGVEVVAPPVHADHVSRPPRRVVVVGDSIPTSLLAAGDPTAASGLQVGVGRLLDQFAAAGIEAWGATITGCPVIRAVVVIDDHPWRRCLETQDEVLPRAMEVRPDLVVWYDRQDAHPVLRGDGSIDTDPANLRRRILERVDWFAARGAKVAFVSPGPNRDGHDAFAPLGSSRRSMSTLDRILHEVAATHTDVVGVIRMADLLCDGHPDRCADLLPGGGTYRADDGVHFGEAGAVAAGQWLVERVAALDLADRPAPVTEVSVLGATARASPGRG